MSVTLSDLLLLCEHGFAYNVCSHGSNKYHFPVGRVVPANYNHHDSKLGKQHEKSTWYISGLKAGVKYIIIICNYSILYCICQN